MSPCACVAFQGCSPSTRSLLVKVSLIFTALGVANFTRARCVLVIQRGTRACFKPEVCQGKVSWFSALESTDYYALVLPPRAGLTGVSRQVLHPMANTLSVLTDFPASIRFSSRWPRGLTTRMARDEAPFRVAPRATTVFLQLAVQTCVASKGCLRSQSDSATTHKYIRLLKGSESDALRPD